MTKLKLIYEGYNFWDESSSEDLTVTGYNGHIVYCDSDCYDLDDKGNEIITKEERKLTCDEIAKIIGVQKVIYQEPEVKDMTIEELKERFEGGSYYRYRF